MNHIIGQHLMDLSFFNLILIRKLNLKGYLKMGKSMAKGGIDYSMNSYYEGDFFNDLRHGSGTMQNSDGSKYEGQFYNDKKHGNGKYWAAGRKQCYQVQYAEDLCIQSLALIINNQRGNPILVNTRIQTPSSSSILRSTLFQALQ